MLVPFLMVILYSPYARLYGETCLQRVLYNYFIYNIAPTFGACVEISFV
jgi:hypothetical protein